VGKCRVFNVNTNGTHILPFRAQALPKLLAVSELYFIQKKAIYKFSSKMAKLKLFVG